MIIYDLNESYTLLDFSEDSENIALALRTKLVQDLSVFVDGYKFIPSVRAGIWDGKKNFFDIDIDMNMRIPKGLAESILIKYHKFITNEYTPITTVTPVSESEVDDFIESMNLPFPPYDFQKEALLISLNQPRKTLISATGSGKSLIIYLIMSYFESIGEKGLLIVPNIGLAEQMKSDFLVDYNMSQEDADKKLHIIYAGKPRNFDKAMTISTWQSAILMNSSHFERLDYVLVDEAHLASGDSLTALLNASVNCLYKIGFTGTMPKKNEAKFGIVATLGKTVNIITPQGLIERGLATPVTIVTTYLNYSENDKARVKRITYENEVKFLEKHIHRTNFICKMAIQVTQKYGNSIMMYSNLKHGQFLLETVLKLKFGIENVVILEKVTPQRIKKLGGVSTDNLFVLTTITERDRKRLSKVYTDEEIQKIRVLDDYHIYLIKGSIEGEQRNLIRGLLEKSGNDMIDIWFGDFKITLNENDTILLNDGSNILAQELTTQHNVDDRWLLDSFGIK